MASMDTRGSALFLCFLLGILTEGITAGTGYDAFHNVGPCAMRMLWGKACFGKILLVLFLQFIS